MNCEDIASSLPWYLNGSLPEQERLQVSEHLKTCAFCRQELEETLWLARAIAEHATHQELIALVRGQTVPNRTAVERHVELCPTCQEKLQLIELMTSVPEQVTPPLGHTLTTPSSVESSPASPRVSPIWRTWAVAATLILALGSGLWLQQGTGAVSPQGTQILVLEKPIPTRNTTPSSSTTFELTGTPSNLIFFYPLSLTEDLSRFDRFTAVLRRGQDIVHSDIAWQPDQNNNSALILPREEIEPGIAHNLVLLGWTGDQSTELESLLFTLNADP